jgi:aminopeptidase N
MTSRFNRCVRSLTGALLLLLIVSAAQADAPFSFETTPGKLSKTVVPIHYAIDLQPNLSALTAKGSAIIDIEVREPTDRLVLNARDLTFSGTTIDDIMSTKSTSVDEDEQTVTFTFARAIAAGRHQLRIAYTAPISNKSGRGLYSADYRIDNSRKRMITSHSEPTDARRIFPGWDEPAFKATFALTLTVPQHFLAVSNTPIAREELLRGNRKRVTFQRTPRMSTYLFVLAAGELERITSEVDGITVGVVTTRGQGATGRYALDQSVALLKYLNDYFGVKYPLPKLDIIAVPSNAASAMEHWGAITIFEGDVLHDPAKGQADAQRGIFLLLAHEIAHQWFGNLVTMAWWNDLWLNEGFASWMEHKAVDRLQPDLQPWLSANGDKQSAMERDVRSNARAMRRPIADEGEARDNFGTTTYSKGQGVVRTIESFVGEDAFRDAMQRYMKERAYSNATVDDLIRALDAAAGKPVGHVLSAYTEQPGVPLVVADARCVGNEQRVALRQDRFTTRESQAQPQRWPVPILLGPPQSASTTILLDGTAEIAAGRCGEAIKLNIGDVGYYRVRYDTEMRNALARSLPAMTPPDRINLLNDAWAMVETLREPPAAYFVLADQLAGDEHRRVIDQLVDTIKRVHKLERGRPGRAAFQAYARALLRPIFERVGWQAADGEASERARIRTQLLGALGDLGDDAVIAEAKRRFAAHLQDPASLPWALREPVLDLVGREADRATYEILHGLGRKSKITAERALYYSALASSLDPALARETLAIALTDEIPNDIARRLIFSVASQGEHADLAVEFVKRNFETLADKFGSSFRATSMSTLMANFSDPARAEELKRFAPAHETSDGRTEAERTRERILADAEFVAWQIPAIDEWVRQHKMTP